MNGRKIRVSFTNTSGLKDIAKALGHDVFDASSSVETQEIDNNHGSCSVSVKDVVQTLKPHEAYDLLSCMKSYIAEDRGARARQLFKEFPQLITAFSDIQLMLGMGLGITASDLQSFSPHDSSTKPFHGTGGGSGYQQPIDSMYFNQNPPFGQNLYDVQHLNDQYPRHHHMHPPVHLADQELIYQVMNMTDKELSMMPGNMLLYFFNHYCLLQSYVDFIYSFSS